MSTTSSSRRSRHQAPASEVLSLVPTSGEKGPFYGHETIARTCARLMTHLFACPVYPPSVTGSTVKLPHFIAYALHRTKLHPSVTFATLMLLQRLKARFPGAKMASGHRLFISAFMVASKVIYDNTYSNKSWRIVAGGIFSLRDINKMEREMCDYLKWEVTFDSHILSNFEKLVTRDFSRDQAFYPSYPPSVVSKCAQAAPTDTQAILDSSITTTATIYIPDQHRGPSPGSLTSYPDPSCARQQIYGPPRSSLPSSLASDTDTPSPCHSNTTSPTTTEPPRTPIGFQSDTAQVHGVGLPPPTPASSHIPIGLENGSSRPFTVVDELPHSHPLRGRMFAFAVPSTF